MEDTRPEPIVPVSKANHQKILEYPFAWKVELAVYLTLFSFLIVGLMYYFEINIFIEFLLAIFTFYTSIGVSKYLVVYRNLGISNEDYRQAKKVPFNLRELREEEHQELKEREEENIELIEDTLDSLRYHRVEFDKDEDGTISIRTTEKEDGPEQSDPILTGSHKIYPDKLSEQDRSEED